MKTSWEDALVDVDREVGAAIEVRSGLRVKTRLSYDRTLSAANVVVIAKVPRWARIFWVFEHTYREGMAKDGAVARMLDATWVRLAESTEHRRAFLALYAMANDDAGRTALVRWCLETCGLKP